MTNTIKSPGCPPQQVAPEGSITEARKEVSEQLQRLYAVLGSLPDRFKTVLSSEPELDREEPCIEDSTCELQAYLVSLRDSLQEIADRIISITKRCQL